MNSNFISAENERIIFVPEIEAFGGGERVLLALSRFLHERSMPHRLVCYFDAINLESYAEQPLPVTELLPYRNPFTKVFALRKFLNATSKGQATPKPLLVGIQSALHAGIGGVGGFSLIIFDTPSLLSRRKGKTWLREQIKYLRERLSRRFIRKAMHTADTVFITTHYMASEIKELYGAEAVVAYQGGWARNVVFRRRPVTRGERCKILTICRLEDNKRIDWIIESLARLDSKSSFKALDWALDIVGNGSKLGKLKKMVCDFNLADRVKFYGQVSDEQLEEIYKDAHLFLMPAKQGYGLPALEALDRGIPVVMHMESGVSEILDRTPWVELINGGLESLSTGIDSMVQRLLKGELKKEPLPSFPSEDDWAENVCRICGWL